MGMNPAEPDPNNPSDAAQSRVEGFAQVGGASSGERWFRAVLENAADVITILNSDGTVRYGSPAGERLTGYRPEERVGTDAFAAVHPDDRGQAMALFREILEKPGLHPPLEFRVPHKDGSWRYVEHIVNNLLHEPSVRGIVINSRDVTERKLTEETLRESESSLTTAQRIAHLGNWDYDITKDQARWSDEMYRIFGFAPRQFVPRYRTFVNSVHPDDRDLIRRSVRKALYEEEQGSVDYRVVRPDGEVRIVQTRYEVTPDVSGRAVKLVGTVHDITERKETEKRLQETEKRYRTVVEQSPAVTYIQQIDHNLASTFVTPQIEGMLGYTPKEYVSIPELWVDILHPDDRERVLAEDARTDETLEPFNVEYRMFAKDGRVVWVRDEAIVARDAEGNPLYWQGVMVDITERKEAEERLQHQAFHDPLTDLPNRQLLLDRLGHALTRTERRRDSRVTVLFMDLDGFKVVNDSLGHEMGDRLLVEVAERLKGCLRAEDTLARFGGDEFIVLLEEVKGADDALRVPQRITEEFLRPFVLDERALFVRFSIGVALSEADTESPEELLRYADIAMYRAKAEAAGYRVFDPEMHEQALSRLEVENDLRHALEREEFTVYYQPKFRLGQPDRIEGIEALVRWEHPEKGFMLPGEFLPLAEETRLIIPLGAWVMKEACRQAKEWQQHYPSEPPLAMCVNLSAGQVRPLGLLKDVRSALQESGLDPGSLIFEITEGTLLKDTQAIGTVFRELKTVGVRLAIDDFGKEYSSLSYLKRLPVDALKIDRSFLENFGEDPSNLIIVEAVVSLAHSLGLEVIAEGVESAEQLELLREMGCDFVQGYHLARPLPGEEMEQLLVNRTTS